MTDLHIRLITVMKTDYRELYLKAACYIDELRKKSVRPNASDIETILNALYGLLLLRLKKQAVSRETEIAMASFSKLLAMLSHLYLQVERGEREI
jgi:hypothetical protein